MRFCDRCNAHMILIGVAPDGSNSYKCTECGWIE